MYTVGIAGGSGTGKSTIAAHIASRYRGVHIDADQVADGNKATIYREVDKGQYSVRVQDLVKRGDISANVDMRPGDILIIPQSWF